MSDEEKNIINMKGGRSYPEAVDGTIVSASQGYNGDDEEDDEEDEREAAKMLPTPMQGKELNAMIMGACEEIAALKLERKAINAEMQAVVETIEAKGIPRASFKICITNMEMTEDQRAAYDLGVLITRGAVGLPVQMDMFAKNAA